MCNFLLSKETGRCSTWRRPWLTWSLGFWVFANQWVTSGRLHPPLYIVKGQVFHHFWHNPKRTYKYSTITVIFSKDCYILVLLKMGKDVTLRDVVLKKEGAFTFICYKCVKAPSSPVSHYCDLFRNGHMWCGTSYRTDRGRLKTDFKQCSYSDTGGWLHGQMDTNFAWLTTDWHKL